MKAFAFLMSALLVSGCAQLGIRHGADKDSVAKIHNVAVYSELTDELNHVFVGTTVFTNKNSSRKVANWHIPQFSESEMIKALEENSVAKKVANMRDINPRAKLASKSDAKAMMVAAKDAGYDTLIVLEPAISGNDRFLKPAYGVFRRSLFGGITYHDCVYASFSVYAVNTVTQEELGWQWNYDSWHADPCTDEHVAWYDDVDAIPAGKMTQLEAIVKRKIAEGVRTAITKLNLNKAQE